MVHRVFAHWSRKPHYALVMASNGQEREKTLKIAFFAAIDRRVRLLGERERRKHGRTCMDKAQERKKSFAMDQAVIHASVHLLRNHSSDVIKAINAFLSTK